MRILNLTQGSPDWLVWRAGGIGGSDAPVLMGESPYATRADLLAEKAGLKKRESTYPMRRGHWLEPLAREQYLARVAASGRPECVVHDDVPWMLASLDGLCRSHADLDGTPWLLEIKAPNWKDHDLALAGLVPAHYRAQVQHMLLVSGLDRLDYVSISENRRFAERDRLAIAPVEPDAEYMAALLDEEEKFWSELQAIRQQRRAA